MNNLAKSEIILGDCIEKMAEMPSDSVDSIVCDPPYHLGFMGKHWDKTENQREWHKKWAVEALRVLKPGGYLLAFGGTRTYHNLASGIEEAGFDIRDQIQWLYGSGFPKSSNVKKSLEKNEVDGSDWAGFGSALKPANEPIVMARKPFKGPLFKNVLGHGTGAINIDDCRVGGEGGLGRFPANVILGHNEDCELVGTSEGEGYSINTFDNGAKPFGNAVGEDYSSEAKSDTVEHWNCTDGCAIAILDEQSGDRSSPWVGNSNTGKKGGKVFGGGVQKISEKPEYKDKGGASRFFYGSKAGKGEKNAGLTEYVENDRFQTRECTQCGKNVPYVGSCGCPDAEIVMVAAKPTKNIHATVKPIDLMRYLIRLVTTPGGTTLDPFLGSGTSGIAAHLEGFDFIGIEKEEEYFDICKARIDWWREREGDTKEILKQAKKDGEL